MQKLKVGRRELVIRLRRDLLGDDFDIREPLTQFQNKTNDLLTSLIADSPHHVDVVDRIIQQCLHGQHVGSFQCVACLGAQWQRKDRCFQLQFVNGNTQVNFFTS